MKINIIKNISKALFLSLLIICIFNVFTIVIEADDNANNNFEKFKKITNSNISKTGIALTINLATRHSAKKGMQPIINSRLYEAKEVLKNNGEIKKALIFDHMLATKEYFSILKTDFRDVLKNTTNKQKTLDEIISQLQARNKLWIKQIQNIEKQKEILIQGMQTLEGKIEIIKKKINNDFKSANSQELEKSINTYLELKHNFQILRTYVVFENKLLNYYKAMNKYNRSFIETFKLNRDIIIKGSYIVIPDSGKELLRDYGLLYTQDEFLEKVEASKKK